MGEPLDVTGGSDGIDADCTAMDELARRLADTCDDALRAAATLHGALLFGDSPTSAALDPAGFATYQAELAWALDGPQGLTWAGGESGALAGELSVAARAYRAADEVAGDLHDVVEGLLDAGPAMSRGAAVLARTGDPIAAADAVAAADPALADVLVDGLDLPALLERTAHELPDGHGVVRGGAVEAGVPTATPPRSLADVLRGLTWRDAQEVHGGIDVRILTLADGSRRVIADITGTKSWDPLPTSDVTSLTTNGRALVGEPTAYEQGVLLALRRAGVRRDDKVMLVGHSEGGMVAVTAARDAVRSGEFDVTHVVTAGSPVGRTVGELPATVQVLALENRRDVVPHLDGRANPDRRNVITASATSGDGTLLGDHGLAGAYVPIAEDVDASHDRSIRDFLTSAGDFFRGTEIRTTTYQVTRRY